MFIDILKAFMLGIVEGVTEFLPISSTGHLILAGNILSFTGEKAKAFEIFIQLGAILAVVWLYRTSIISVIYGIGKKESNRFAGNILIAILPVVVIGLLTHTWIKAYLFNPVTVAVALIAGGFLIIIIEKTVKKPRVAGLDSIPAHFALGIGLAQVLSLFPGVSRSGATIMGGMAIGLDRKTATEFSFFLAMPTMLAATSYDLFKNIRYLAMADIYIFAVGFLTAFISALLVIKAFLRFIARSDFTPFAYYRIVFGLLVLLLLSVK